MNAPSLTPSRAARPLVVAVAAALLALVLTLGGALTARADDTIGVSGAPATDTGDADGRTRFSYELDPGQQVNDFYLVSNTGTTAQEFTILATDAYNDNEGNYGLLATEEDPSEIGTWVRFEGDTGRLRFTLEPGESRLVPFTVTVPADARPGDHAGGIGASVVTPEGQVLVDRRIASRMYVRVSGELQPLLAVSSLEASHSTSWNPFAGDVTITYTIQNTGNVALAARSVADVRTWFGIHLGGDDGYVREELAELLPGNARTVEVTVPGIGAWGLLQPAVAIQPFAEGEMSEPVNAPQSFRDTTIIAVPWLLLAVLLVAAAAWLVIRQRRKSDEKRAAAWMQHMEAEARRKALEEPEQTLVASQGGNDRA
ncbi:DUF916 domain-containing protein [Microbacterium album]|uniref:DUF916 domain-containing protein n=1 Tax=Microbacterium album TaxID=2053191 RepID=A0A917MPJ9_9MICO|nr:DUF916 domain-containing protein [Microbacterium album]GGH47844.1 hypothetical protein GCM10010921_24880 [Microbacterium album]